VIDADAVLLDLYDTVADGAWGDLARIVMDRIGVDREALFRAFDETRPARSIGAFASAEGDMAAVIAAPLRRQWLAAACVGEGALWIVFATVLVFALVTLNGWQTYVSR